MTKSESTGSLVYLIYNIHTKKDNFFKEKLILLFCKGRNDRNMFNLFIYIYI